MCLAFLVPLGLVCDHKDLCVSHSWGENLDLCVRCASWPELEVDDSVSGAQQGNGCGAQAGSEEGGGCAESRLRQTHQARPQHKIFRTGLDLEIWGCKEKMKSSDSSGARTEFIYHLLFHLTQASLFCSSSCPGSHYVDQAGLETSERCM